LNKSTGDLKYLRNYLKWRIRHIQISSGDSEVPSTNLQLKR